LLSVRSLAVIPVLVALVSVASPDSANAAKHTPSPPAGLHVSAVTSSSITVSAHASSHATHYRLFAATHRGDLAVNRISSAHRSGLADQPTMTVTGLHYTSAPYYYRVEALNSTKKRFSPEIGHVTLRPRTPAALTAHSSAGGVSLTWKHTAASDFTVEQSTDAKFRQTVTYAVRHYSGQFSPYHVSPGTQYYFRVRARNGSSTSDYSSPAATQPSAREQAVRVMTYNILDATRDGHREGGQRIAGWSKRRAVAAHLISQAQPDVVAIQEGAPFVGHKERQVDSLHKSLSSSYGLAHTEVPPTHRHYLRTGSYLLYRKAAYKPIGSGGHWALGDKRWAAYHFLENRQTHARFLAISAHLLQNSGRAADKRREAETKRLVHLASAMASHHHTQVVYAGDFNSHPGKDHPLDGPGKVMAFHHIVDARTAAQSRSMAHYNSANQYLRTPPHTGDDIDHVFAPPGVGVASWSLVEHLQDGHFVGVMPSDHNPLVSTVLVPY
jgi:endonuclease/exonuclease/phosphatase family metal-dependent hydrolase